MEVKGNHPLAEVIAKKLFSITSVPKEEQERMVNRACKSAVEYHEQYVIKARIEELEDISKYCSHEKLWERIAQLKKGIKPKCPDCNDTGIMTAMRGGGFNDCPCTCGLSAELKKGINERRTT